MVNMGPSYWQTLGPVDVKSQPHRNIIHRKGWAALPSIHTSNLYGWQADSGVGQRARRPD